MARNKHYWVSASEVAAYVYCAESWRLGHGLGKPSRNRQVLQRGTAEHAQWQTIERFTKWQTKVAVILMLAGLIWGAALWLIGSL